MVTQVSSKADFLEKLNDAGEKLVVVDFTASWCGPCRMIAPKLVEWAGGDFKGVVFLKVDVDELVELTGEYDVKGMPTFIFFRNGVRIEGLEPIVGANENALRDTISKHQ